MTTPEIPSLNKEGIEGWLISALDLPLIPSLYKEETEGWLNGYGRGVRDQQGKVLILNQQHRIQLFDEWAKNYDSSIKSTDHAFPFDGYEEVLDEMVRQAAVESSMLVLDLGIGTGNLAGRFIARGCTVWGIDFSSVMLSKTRAKLPQAHLVQADFFDGWPIRTKQCFDRIVSAYVLHEFDLASKVSLLRRLALNQLSTSGRIVIGDIAFLTAQDRKQAHARWTNRWDEDEDYWVADETIAACKKAGLQAVYTQVSSCGGVFVIEPMVKP